MRIEKNVINCAAETKQVLIWLHGLGADMYDFEFLGQLDYFKNNSFQIILPNAPIRPVAINNNALMPAWHDIASPDFNYDYEGINASTEAIVEIASEIDINTKIYLGGFSQGAAIALHSGLELANRVSGVIAFSGYLPFFDRIEISKEAAKLPFLICHGRADQTVPFHTHSQTVSHLESVSSKVVAKEYEIGHEVSLEQLRDLFSFIDQA